MGRDPTNFTIFETPVNLESILAHPCLARFEEKGGRFVMASASVRNQVRARYVPGDLPRNCEEATWGASTVEAPPARFSNIYFLRRHFSSLIEHEAAERFAKLVVDDEAETRG